jgi:hypothetical protein
MGAGAYINDFIKSTNPRFVNKSKEERRRMAIGAYMAAKAKGIKEENKDHTPVAPVPDRKYIKGTPEWKAHKEKSKPINGHPTNVKEEQIDEKSEQAKRNKTMKNLMAASKGAKANRDSGLGIKPADTGHKNARDMNVALGRAANRGEFTEENNNRRKFKFFKGQEHFIDPKEIHKKDSHKAVKEGVEQPSGDDSIPTQTSAPGQMDGERASKKKGFKTSLVKISKNSVARETEEGWEEPKIKGSK